MPIDRKETDSPDQGVLHLAWRMLAVAIGLSVLGAGAYAIFETKVEAGPVALVTAGFLLMVIGMSGRSISEIQYGDKKISLQRERAAMQDFAEEVIDETGGERSPQTVKALEALDDAAPAIANPALRALLYQEQILAMLREIQQRSVNEDFDVPAFSLVQPTYGSSKPMIDALLITPSNAGVVVEIKSLSRMVDAKVIVEFDARTSRFQKIDARAQVGLLITRSQLTNAAVAQLRNDSVTEIEHVWVSGTKDSSWLEQTVRHALEKAQALVARTGPTPE